MDDSTREEYLEDQIESLNLANENLGKENDAIKKKLQSNVNTHCKFADDAISLENVRVREFNQERKELNDDLKNLKQLNKTLTKKNDDLKALIDSYTLDPFSKRTLSMISLFSLFLMFSLSAFIL